MTSGAEASYTLITCHAGDPYWVTHCTQQVDRLSDERVASVVVVDQSRSSAKTLEALPRVDRVLTFPVDEAQVGILGHDHPAALNRALNVIEFDTSHVIILDSDCFPVDAQWLDKLTEVTMASEPAYWSLSHPCLMAFPVSATRHLDFAEGISEIGIDTGRLAAIQLARAGFSVTLTPPTAAFSGYRGHFYLGRSVYHHGSASFVSADDERLTRQVEPRTEARFRTAVAEGRFTLSATDRLWLKRRGATRKLKRLMRRN